MIALAGVFRVALEAVWWTVVLQVASHVVPGAVRWSGWPATVALMLVAYVASRLLDDDRLGERTARFGFVASAVAAIGAALFIHASLLADVATSDAGVGVPRSALDLVQVVLLSILLLAPWLRAANIARREPRLVDVSDSFQWGLAVLLLGGIAGIASGRPLLLALTLGLFVFGLPAMALTRVAERTGEPAGQAAQPWLVSVTVAIALVFAAGGLLAGLASTELTTTLLGWAGSLGYALLGIVLIPVALLFGIGAWLLDGVIRRLLALLGPVEPPRRVEPDLAPPDYLALLRDAARWVPEPVLQLLGGLLLAGSLALGLALAYRLLARRERRELPGQERRDRVGSIASAAGDLFALLQSAAGKLRSAPRVTVPDPVPGASTRELYRWVLFRLRGRGAARSAGQTPAMFEPNLAASAEPRAAADLTRAYERERYGGRADAAAARERRRAYWRRAIEESSNSGGTPR